MRIWKYRFDIGYGEGQGIIFAEDEEEGSLKCSKK